MADISNFKLKISNFMQDLVIKVENACPVDYAIKVNGVSKTFRIPARNATLSVAGGPHEKITTIRGAFVSVLNNNET